jgi:hypothetical protein
MREVGGGGDNGSGGRLQVKCHRLAGKAEEGTA